ncbi:MAG TPA: hypothetical protein VMJ52_08895 [Xanthobacteraceae bacterium]|nr:hypothetical protein [Xanthobacteraceae bacterium]
MSASNDTNSFGRRDAVAEPRTVVPTDRARQGVTGHNVRYVLGIGLAAVVIAFLALYLAYFG